MGDRNQQNIVGLDTWQTLFERTNRPYYEVSGRKYFNKVQAIIETKRISQATGLSPWQILKFNFFNNLASTDFSQEPTDTYQQLCHQRARQLRAKYKYIRLYYSGGVDSHTTLRSFYEAGLPLDEIVIINNATLDAYTPSNIETTALVLPNINRIQSWFPTAKINILDYVFNVDIVNDTDNSNWLSRLQKIVPGWHLARNPSSAFDIDSSMLQAFDGDSHCELVGEPKPSIVKKNGQWYTYQVDNQIEGVLTLPGLELFHLSADFPELYIKQCHMLKRGHEQLMNDKPESYSLELNKDFNQKNIFLERVNEWDVNEYSRRHNEWGKKTTAGGDIRGMVHHHEVMSRDAYFSDYYKKFNEVYKKEIYDPYTEFFDRGEHWKSTKGLLSLFWNLDQPGSYTADELWPTGFGVY